MYQIPKRSVDFDIDIYFELAADVSDLIHRDWPFLKSGAESWQLKALLMGIQKSLSLDRVEKMKIINAKLVEFQVDQLLEVFKDEAIEFRKIMATENNAVFDLAVRANNDWIEHLLPALIIGPSIPDNDEEKMAFLEAMMATDQEGTPEFA